jgi:glutaminyl-tRNA synthetase
MSKRKLLELVQKKIVGGWNDPRMPTISGMRRRGYTPEAIRAFCARIGVAKFESTIDFRLLEYFVREHLNKSASRYMAVLNPIKLVIENYPEGHSETLEAVNNPEDPSAGTRSVPFSREIYIEREDFMLDPPAKFWRLAPGREVRLRYAYFVKCVGVVTDENGEVTEVRCTYDPATRGGDAPDGRKVKTTLHWVSALHAKKADVRLYENLFVKEDPYEVAEGGNWLDNLNPNSLKSVTALVEPALAEVVPGSCVQFERIGYFRADEDSKPGSPVFNRTVTLKDDWAKMSGAGK